MPGLSWMELALWRAGGFTIDSDAFRIYYSFGVAASVPAPLPGSSPLADWRMMLCEDSPEIGLGEYFSSFRSRIMRVAGLLVTGERPLLIWG